MANPKDQELAQQRQTMFMGETLRGTLEALPARERLILRLRFEEDLTQAEIAETVGVSQMHVSRLLRRSLDRLSAAGAAAA